MHIIQVIINLIIKIIIDIIGYCIILNKTTINLYNMMNIMANLYQYNIW